MGKVVSISGKMQSGKNTVAKIWQLLDVWYNVWTQEDRNYFNLDVNDFVIKYLHQDKFIDSKYGYNDSQLIGEYTSWEQKSFAKKIKEIGAILFGCKVEDFEDNDFKNRRIPQEWGAWRVWENKLDKEYNKFDIWTPETALYGIELDVHEAYHPDRTIEEWLPTYREFLQYVGTELFRKQFHPNIWALALFNDIQADDNVLITDARFKNELNVIENNYGIPIRVRRYGIGSKVARIVSKRTGPECRPRWGAGSMAAIDPFYGGPERTVPYIIEGFLIKELYDDYCIIKSDDDICYDCKYNEICEGKVDGHISEIDLDDYYGFSYYIDNHTDINNLIKQVKNIMVKENVIKIETI